MSRYILLLLLLLFLIRPSDGFSPQHQATIQTLLVGAARTSLSAVHPTTKHPAVTHRHRKIDEITHELEELLGTEIKPHVMHEAHGLNEYHESLVHKLRRTIHEHDLHYR
jgi:hypothetical protein